MNPAGITLSEILRLPVLKNAKLISGEKGLNRVVRFVDIMEVPDVRGWLREGELLLTTAYSIRHDPMLLPSLVEQLDQAGAAALAIKPERFLHDVPIEMIQMSNKYNLPIIQLPNNIPYMDITHAVMEQIIDKQASLLRRSEEIYKDLTSLVLDNRGIQAVADKVSSLLKSPIWLVDKAGEIIVCSPATVRESLSSDLHFRNITVDQQVEGKLLIEKNVLDDFELVCIEQARLVFSLELMRRKTAMETEMKLRGDFIDELLSGLLLSKQVIINKGTQLGLKPELVWEIAIVEYERDKNPLFIVKLTEFMNKESQSQHMESYVHVQPDRVVLLLASQYEDRGVKKTPEDNVDWTDILTPFLAKWKGVRLGFGGKAKLWELNRSYLEAKKALAIGTRMNIHQRLFTFKDFELIELLMDTSRTIEMEKFVEEKLGTLRQYDQDHQADLIKTLYYYILTHGSLMETAKHLFIHRNSVKYRIDKIKELCDINLDSFQERFSYYYCILYYFLKKESE
ncbi:PucR family transcriptional regulator [Bacillus litorisediminis]|uniref:PucR family transcriptional regulator n=1 Tax=Bacillus litorisediminis TaxID=2922713 RepID=UPI001FAF3F79|nr:PucR family transcriptional regulator [Bacillus litorisediminis]